MAENEVRETCSITFCVRPAISSEHGQVGHWNVTIFYCDEHARQIEEGTPLGAIGVDGTHVRIEHIDGSQIPGVMNRFPGLA